jgi:3-deoxy-7-phosphoheptulonate synthase
MSEVVPKTDDINIMNMVELRTPTQLKALYPLSDNLKRAVFASRHAVNEIVSRQSSKFMVITGPCSIHDEKSAYEYAERLIKLSDQVKDKILIVMRIYFEKPRTTVGWKGLISDPNLTGVCDINLGLEKARKILIKIVSTGLPAATEFLDPITPQYISDLLSWVAIGARTTESQTHRELASGVSAAVGFKNGTSGSLDVALNAMESSSNPHSFLGIDQSGVTKIINTKGNKLGHLVLRGGDSGPNYDEASIKFAEESLRKRKMNEAMIVDCSHSNSNKDHKNQPTVLKNIIEQKKKGNKSIVGAMLESHLLEGNQPLTADPTILKYGVSITDKCIDWATTESLIKEIYNELA